MDILCLFMEDNKAETKVYCRIERGRDVAAILRRVQGHVKTNIRLKLENLVKQETYRGTLAFTRNKLHFQTNK